MKKISLVAVCACLVILCVFHQYALADEPDIYLLREASDTWVTEGSFTTLCYTFRNMSDTAATQVTITDILAGEVAQIDRVNSGESVTVSLRLRVNEDCVSDSDAFFTWRGEVRQINCQPLDINVDSPSLSLRLSEEERGQVTALIQNEGHSPLYDVSLSEKTLGAYGCVSNCLEPGESVIVRKVLDQGDWSFSASAVTASGERIIQEADSISTVAISAEETLQISNMQINPVIMVSGEQTSSGEPDVTFSHIMTVVSLLLLFVVSVYIVKTIRDRHKPARMPKIEVGSADS
ncbi:MAG: DUF11 domain-containing protein [Clostridia bacterium]|nr:DUF11 domain-containing protein [Clostridia bacterium]